MGVDDEFVVVTCLGIVEFVSQLAQMCLAKEVIDFVQRFLCDLLQHPSINLEVFLAVNRDGRHSLRPQTPILSGIWS